MRSFIVALVPALALSLSVIACSADANDNNVPETENNQSQLVAEGGECDETNPCQAGLVCEAPAEAHENSIVIKGLPAPCSTDCNPTPAPAPTTTTTPTPAPAPTTTTPATPQPVPAKVCVATAK